MQRQIVRIMLNFINSDFVSRTEKRERKGTKLTVKN